MKASQTPLFTQKEDPKDAVVASHKLLSRAGYIKKQASGFYAYLPFGYIVHRKIEEIIRTKMNKYGAVETHLPVLTPAELWQVSGRWSSMGPEMMRLSDRHNVNFALGPTHEESITWLAKQYLHSYKQLPINFYQIGKKYRDEIRPRFGLIRCREFVMKDAYSFHIDDASLEETYQKMRECYREIFDECGLETLSVEADSGAMGGSGSEEFMVPSAIGEETLLLCPDNDCQYRSNQEKTMFKPQTPYSSDKSNAAAERVDTPDVKTVEEVANFLKAEKTSFIKSVIYENSSAVVLAFIPGDRDISETKLKNLSGEADLEMASPESIEKVSSAPPGFAGPFELNVKNGDEITVQGEKKNVIILYDKNLKNRGNLISGGNMADTHCINLQEARDFIIPEGEEYDLVQAKESDLCPKCGKHNLKSTKGIEVGHVFKLGKKYTEALDVSVLDAEGRPSTLTMGCYGIGVGRTLSTIVEQNYDEKGIIWPESAAPFRYYMIGISKTEEEKKEIDDLYERLIEKNISVYYDDRKERPGIKFNDADLTGFPFQITIGKNYFENKKIELKIRKTMQKSEMAFEELFS
ncbi:MAG: proline--tRNA ligase [Spirochaetia bacterium]|nr:proline--tRNA ligase [Spirochaetia bacterium]